MWGGSEKRKREDFYGDAPAKMIQVVDLQDRVAVLEKIILGLGIDPSLPEYERNEYGCEKCQKNDGIWCNSSDCPMYVQCDDGKVYLRDYAEAVNGQCILKRLKKLEDEKIKKYGEECFDFHRALSYR